MAFKEADRFSGLARSVTDRSFRAGGGGKRLQEAASAGFSGKGFSQAPGPGGLKPPFEKDRKRPSGEGEEAADPGVNTGSHTLRARPLKRPPRKGHYADRFASDRWKSKFQISLAGLSAGCEGTPPSSMTFPLPPGTYTVTETGPASRNLAVGSSCDDGGSSISLPTKTATIMLASGATVTCTFQSEDEAP